MILNRINSSFFINNSTNLKLNISHYGIMSKKNKKQRIKNIGTKNVTSKDRKKKAVMNNFAKRG